MMFYYFVSHKEYTVPEKKKKDEGKEEVEKEGKEEKGKNKENLKEGLQVITLLCPISTSFLLFLTL